MEQTVERLQRPRSAVGKWSWMLALFSLLVIAGAWAATIAGNTWPYGIIALCMVVLMLLTAIVMSIIGLAVRQYWHAIAGMLLTIVAAVVWLPAAAASLGPRLGEWAQGVAAERRRQDPYGFRVNQSLQERPCEIVSEKAADRLSDGLRVRIGNATFQPLQLAAKRWAGSPIWSDDGQFVYTASKDGVLQLISVPDFMVRRELNTGGEIASIAMCSVGLIVTRGEQRDLLLIDPSDLIVQKRFAIPGNCIAAGSPKLDHIYLAVNRGRELWAVDVANGRVLTKQSHSEVPPADAAGDMSRPRHDCIFEAPQLSAGGDVLFCQGRNNNYPGINRLLVDDPWVTFDRFDRLNWDKGRPIIPSDSDSPIHDWLELQAGDPQTGNLYSLYRETLYVLANDGKPAQEFALPSTADPRRADFLRRGGNVLVHPMGRKLLVWGDWANGWIELDDSN